MKKLLTLICLVALANVASAQVQKVKYSLEYNDKSCLFDVYVNIQEGKSKTVIHRAQLNSQVSIVAPAAAVVSVEDSYMPLVDNQQYRSDKAAAWEVTTSVNAPEAAPGKSFHSITPFVTPAAFYADIKEGDKIKIFSVSISPMVDCAADVKLFENDRDPLATSDGMKGADFRNGFTVGALHQSYNGNTEVVRPTAPSIDEILLTNTGIKANVTAGGSSCQGDLLYQWYNGTNLIKTGTQVPSLSTSQIASGKYKLVVTDELGCKVERNVAPDNGAAVIEQTIASNETASTELFTAVYPNPAKNYFNVELSGAEGKSVVAQMVATDGKVVMSNLLDSASREGNIYRVSLDGMATGAYNVNVVVDGKEVKSHRVIIVQ